ncbi:hypothetical protein BDV26DRAFT_89810 [Aspergillus bertholletiae]|uniref:Uncharacterized protein n=1 Tax=Aspergillus bertholletiae TaxID=1226010 RepID=A0A5N7AS21_9EURO|nr:hypothetical protein BDV26DRAFT_89810 [Aspergillus bertholletiae]
MSTSTILLLVGTIRYPQLSLPSLHSIRVSPKAADRLALPCPKISKLMCAICLTMKMEKKKKKKMMMMITIGYSGFAPRVRTGTSHRDVILRTTYCTPSALMLLRDALRHSWLSGMWEMTKPVASRDGCDQAIA